MGKLQRLRNRLSLPTRAEFIAYTMLIIVLVLAAYFIFMPVLGDQFLDLRSVYTPRVIIGMRITEIPEAEIENLHLEEWQQDYYSKFNVLPTVLSLEYIYIPQNILSNGQVFCINEISIVSTLPQINESKLLEIPLCFGRELHVGMNQLIVEPRVSKAFVYSKFVDQFWYPFDSRTLEFSLAIQVPSDNAITFTPGIQDIQVANTPPRWVSKISWSQSMKNASETRAMEIKMTRPPVYKLLFLLVLFGVPCLSERLFGYAVRKESLWETILGLLLGLWSLTQVLIPDYIGFPTLSIYVILFLYIYLILRIGVIHARIDDLKKIDGIGPKVAKTLYQEGINSYRRLSKANPDLLQKIIDEEKGSQNIDPASWIQQARLAAKGDWDGLKKFQNDLKAKKSDLPIK